MDNQKNFWQIVKEASILISIGVLAILVLNFSTDIFKTPREKVTEKITEKETIIEKPIIHEPEPKPSEYPDYEILGSLKALTLIENKISWSPEGNPEKIIGFEKQLKSSGEFAKVYIYIEASSNDKPLTQYASIYIKFNNEGGHLFRPQSLKIPPDTITRLLYAVNNVPYLETIPYSESKTPTTTNWFVFFKHDESITFNAFISSLKPIMINKIVLYYDCIENSDCKVEIK